MGRDDWKYEEDAWDEREDEGRKAAPPPEKPWAQCLHRGDPELLYCPWCGKPIRWKDRGEK